MNFIAYFALKLDSLTLYPELFENEHFFVLSFCFLPVKRFSKKSFKIQTNEWVEWNKKTFLCLFVCCCVSFLCLFAVVSLSSSLSLFPTSLYLSLFLLNTNTPFYPHTILYKIRFWCRSLLQYVYSSTGQIVRRPSLPLNEFGLQ